MLFIRLCTLALFVTLTFPLLAGEVVFQNDDVYTGTDGVVLKGEHDSQRRTNHYGSVEWTVAGVSWGGPKTLLLVRFDHLTGEKGIPAGAKIQSALLDLYKVRGVRDQGQYNPTSMIHAYKLLTPFYPQDSTFAERAPLSPEEQYWGSSHSIEDGPVAGVDFDKENNVASALLTPDEIDTWIRFDVTNAVAGWLREPESNHGLLLQANQYWIGATFLSPHSDDAMLRPRLTIHYFSDK